MAGLFKWGTKTESSPVAAAPPPAPAPRVEPASTSKVLPKFLAALAGIEAPVLMDVGPVVGSNIAFFGDHLSCKFFVEDLFAEVETHRRKGTEDTLPLAVTPRLSHAPGSIDGILCWDLFDYLDKKTSQALSARLVSLLKPGGALYGFFGTAPADVDYYTRFVVDAPDQLRLRQVPAAPTKRGVIVNRDLNKMFEGLIVSESVLLKSSTREILFRKP